MRKLKVLCLHGYRQNGPAFRQKSGGLRKVLKSYAEFVFLSAPNVLPRTVSNDAAEKNDEEEVSSDATTDQRAWWFSQKECTFSGREHVQSAYLFAESVAAIEEACANEGPFDGILGFSQGAAMAALICCLAQSGDFSSNFSFVVLIAGFESRSADHAIILDTVITVPSLHIFGDADQIIPKEMSLDLARRFSNAEILSHPGGHYIPSSTSSLKESVRSFFAKEQTKLA